MLKKIMISIFISILFVSCNISKANVEYNFVGILEKIKESNVNNEAKVVVTISLNPFSSNMYDTNDENQIIEIFDILKKDKYTKISQEAYEKAYKKEEEYIKEKYLDKKDYNYDQISLRLYNFNSLLQVNMFHEVTIINDDNTYYLSNSNVIDEIKNYTINNLKL